MSDILTPAFVLHTRKYGENHLLVDMLTRLDGRLSLMVRGGAAAKSMRRGMLQPFTPLRILYSGRGDIQNLKQIEQMSAYVLLQGKALYSGFYLNELIVRLITQKEPVPYLFKSYELAISRLKQEDEPDGILRYFELELLQTLGYGVDLLHEGCSGKKVDVNAVYGYRLETGLEQMSSDSKYLIGGDTLHVLSARTAMTAQQTKEARDLMRHILKYYLGDKPLKSRELFLKTH
jgi:DNA repair protein RecO (recombination protein O)